MMFDSLAPIWLFLGGLVLRYGGDLLKTIVQFGLQRLACQITIAETNPIYSADSNQATTRNLGNRYRHRNRTV